MFTDKLRKGMKISTDKKPDISFWAGSNDFIPYNFFEQVIDYYDDEKRQIYGINKFANGENIHTFCYFDGIKNEIDKSTGFLLWNGYDSEHRKHFIYIAGIIGLNKNIYQNHPEIINNWNVDEGIDERNIIALPNIDIFYSKNIHWFNIKTVSNAEITTISDLSIVYSQLIKYKDLSIISKNIFRESLYNLYKIMNNEINEFNDLIKYII
jgi:hypothetical protein